jgi:hypothetical protein
MSTCHGLYGFIGRFPPNCRWKSSYEVKRSSFLRTVKGWGGNQSEQRTEYICDISPIELKISKIESPAVFYPFPLIAPVLVGLLGPTHIYSDLSKFIS